MPIPTDVTKPETSVEAKDVRYVSLGVPAEPPVYPEGSSNFCRSQERIMRVAQASCSGTGYLRGGSGMAVGGTAREGSNRTPCMIQITCFSLTFRRRCDLRSRWMLACIAAFRRNEAFRGSIKRLPWQQAEHALVRRFRLRL